jgi:Rod binding domain-containing protein
MQSITATSSPSSANGAASGVPQPRLVRAAHEFEAQMMQELMKSMTKGASITGDDDEDSDSGAGSGGALGEFASEALAQAMSNQGGFGIAHRIVDDLSHSGNTGVTIPVTGNLHRNTVMSETK